MKKYITKALNPAISRYNLVSWLLLFFLALIWGSSFILIKKSLISFSAGEVGALRIISASIFLLPFALNRLKGLDYKKLKILFLSGFIGSLLPAFLFALAETKLESSITGILNALTPIFVLLLGIIFFKHQLLKKEFWGILLGLSGSLLLIMIGHSGTVGSFNIFAILVVVATLMYGTNLNIIKSFLQDVKPVTIASVSLLLMGPLAGLYLFTYTEFPVKLSQIEHHYLSLISVLTLGVIGTAFALILFNKLVQMTSAVFSSSVTYLIPIVAVVWGFVDGEQLFFLHFFALAFILLGVYLLNKA
ncbi:MAG: DMT family transporter [Candidatus Cyclobacteriaceae bacterium M3_2C_046]